MLTVPHAHINTLNDVLYARILCICVCICICVYITTVWEMPLIRTQLLSIPFTNADAKAIIQSSLCFDTWQCCCSHIKGCSVHKPLLWSNNTGVSRVKSLCLSTLLCLIHKGVMKMVAPLLWKCNSWLPPEMDFWSLVFYLTPFHSKIHQMVMNTQHWAQEERSGDRYAFRGTEGHRDLYRDVCSPVCFYWNRSSCQVEISKTNTRQSFIRIHVLSTT